MIGEIIYNDEDIKMLEEVLGIIIRIDDTHTGTDYYEKLVLKLRELIGRMKEI